MTEHVEAGKIKAIIEEMGEVGEQNSQGFIWATMHWKEMLEKLVSGPTLEDMTDIEQAGCQWMQAHIEGWGNAILTNIGIAVCQIVSEDGETSLEYDFSKITPRSDLPKLNPWEQKAPRIVKTEDDYISLPEGSIVTLAGDNPWIKKGSAFFSPDSDTEGISLWHMVGTARHVLREGWSLD